MGERHDPETHLIPLVLKTATEERGEIAIHGTDYDTPDRTCIRDYIHVMDLVDAHLRALQYLVEGNPSDTFNCGYGHGYSVREVINISRAVTGKVIPTRESVRREGDSPVLVSDNTKIRQKLNWVPRYDDLEYIVRTAWEWKKKNATRSS